VIQPPTVVGCVCIPSSLDAPMFTPFHSSPQSNATSTTDSPALGSPPPQSPNSQLTMSLLNNLIQIQGLENSIAQQQLAGSMPQPSSSSSPSSSNNLGSSSTTSTAPASSSSPSSNSSYNPQMLEQQIKLSQLQQLQQLQNQIFQQQVMNFFLEFIFLFFFFLPDRSGLIGWTFFGFRSRSSVDSPRYCQHRSFWTPLGW
jgi:hypothetical protein